MSFARWKRTGSRPIRSPSRNLQRKKSNRYRVVRSLSGPVFVPMHTPIREAIAQLMFWGSIAGLPMGVLMFACAFRFTSMFARYGSVAVGGLLLTQFLWYFVYLGVGLSTKVIVVALRAGWVWCGPVCPAYSRI